MLHNTLNKKESPARQFNRTGNSVSERKKQISMIWGGIGLLLLLFLDQLTKYLAYTILKPNGSVVLLPGIFELHYLENQGAAFGMMENMQWIFILFALLISAAAIWLYFHIPMERKFIPMQILCITLTAGAIGNMIDRILHGYVIDFLYFSLINFPIFNVADIYVCVSTAAFLILILFYYTEEDFDRMMGKKSRKEYVSDIIEKIQESQRGDSNERRKTR